VTALLVDEGQGVRLVQSVVEEFLLDADVRAARATRHAAAVTEGDVPLLQIVCPARAARTRFLCPSALSQLQGPPVFRFLA